MDHQEEIRLFKALADESRLRILHRLEEGETCACRLLDDLMISQPTLSHHMKLLKDAGLIRCRKDGKWTRYQLHEDGWKQTKDLLNELTKGKCR